MKVFSLEKDGNLENTFVALGTFDGLHQGHEKVIATTLSDPLLTATVLSVLPQKKEDSLLTLPQEKVNILEKMGVAVYLPTPLTALQHLSPEDFVKDILVKKLGAKKVSCGFNFRFGNGAEGDTTTLANLCKEYGITLTVCSAMTDGTQPISSSRIRTALKQGDLTTVTRLLGRPFGFCFPVCEGNRLGNQLGFPTINQQLPKEMITPKFGVYAVEVTVEGQVFAGVCNIGLRPTVGDLTAPLAETHILGFDGDLYGKEVDVRLLSFLRGEKRFENLDHLKEAIRQDALQAEAVVKRNRKEQIHEVV